MLKELIESNLMIVKKAMDRRNKTIAGNLSAAFPSED